MRLIAGISLTLMLLAGCSGRRELIGGGFPPDPWAPIMPVEIHYCGAFNQVLEIDDDRILVLRTLDEFHHAKSSPEELNSVRRVVDSAPYRTQLQGHRDDSLGIICLGQPRVVIIHKSQRLKFIFRLDETSALPASITELLEVADAIGGRRFGAFYHAMVGDIRGVKSNNPIKLSVRVVTPRAVARVAPTRPAAYRVRWADQEE